VTFESVFSASAVPVFDTLDGCVEGYYVHDLTERAFQYDD
jgi:hypothetical protein